MSGNLQRTKTSCSNNEVASLHFFSPSLSCAAHISRKCKEKHTPHKSGF